MGGQWSIQVSKGQHGWYNKPTEIYRGQQWSHVIESHCVLCIWNV